jgi:preprotein translocase subunit SecY
MLEKLSKSIKIPQLRNKIIITLLVIALFRFLSHVPVPFVNTQSLKAFFDSSQLLGIINLFSGGGLQNLSIVALSVGPYITSSIIIQVLTMVVPKLEELAKEGQTGRQKLNQYTQTLTLPIALIQAYGVYFMLNTQTINNVPVINYLSPADLIIFILTLTAGSFLLLWVANLITDYGVGQGVSVIIFAGILSGIPSSLQGLFAGGGQLFNILILVAVFLAVIMGVVYINQSFRKIEVLYSSKMRGGRLAGGGNSYIPIKINQAGVIPIIFAVSLILLPQAVAGYMSASSVSIISSIGLWLQLNFNTTAFLYNALYFLLVFGFTYFYTSITFNPHKIAEDIRNSGGFIPGIRPGRATEEYLKYVINRLTLAGGVFLGVLAILPTVLQSITNINSLSIGGTSLLIVVSVALETVKQLESQVITREYESLSR